VSQVDPWEKASDCDRALKATVDPVHRDILTTIRASWVSLANDQLSLTEAERARRAELISRYHAKLIAATSLH
jgi:hypothetical protein